MTKRNNNLPVDGRNAFDREREANDAFSTDEEGLRVQLPLRTDDERPYETEEITGGDLVDEIVERDEDEAMLSARRIGVPALDPEHRARPTADDADEEEEEATSLDADPEIRGTADVIRREAPRH